MQPLTREQLRDALRKGLGRAWLHLRHFGPDGMQDLIEDACLHNLAYDIQFDGDRSDWIWWLIELSGRKDELRDRILAALPVATEYADRALLFSLALSFVEEGHEPARQAMYFAYRHQPHNFPHAGGLHLVDLDGLPGFVWAAESIGHWLLSDPGYHAALDKSGNNDWFLGNAEERLDRQEMLAALRERATANEAIRTYLEFSKDWLESSEENPRVSRRPPWDDSPLAAEDFIAAVDSLAWKRYRYPIELRRVEPAGVELIFERMLQETRPEQLHHYLHAFIRQPVPRLDPQLFAWTDSTEKGISEAAYAVLARTPGPAVREFLLERLRQPDAGIRPGVLDLFTTIFQPGDEALLTGLPVVVRDDDEAHGVVIDIKTLLGKVSLPAFTPLLLWAYENSPCGECRNSVVAHLIKLDCAPKKLLHECRWDSNEETRELVRTPK